MAKGTEVVPLGGTAQEGGEKDLRRKSKIDWPYKKRRNQKCAKDYGERSVQRRLENDRGERRK